ncbi:MAG: ABC transporter permease [Blautia sp.]|nr:ABC transporter permease [Blautia sp.]
MDHDMNKTSKRQMTVRHRGRFGQVGIYLGKQLRMFIYQNDWKVLPMAALIAGLVGMVIRNRMFDSMEGTVMGCLALACVGIWNGCFNSIQVVCRERDIIKRQHRSGMHISSYVFSHMIYQLLLCSAQTGITMYITKLTGVKYGLGKPLFTPWFIVDFAISMLLITYASDMMSLWVSSIANNTTTAMTIMPFVLIFQLVFSGSMLTLPKSTEPLTHFTISNPGIKVLAAQADYNSLKVKTLWNTLEKMRDYEISGSITAGQILDLLENKDNETVAEIREKEINASFTLGQASDLVLGSRLLAEKREETVLKETTFKDLLTIIRQEEEFEETRNIKLEDTDYTLGMLIDAVLSDSENEAWLQTPCMIGFTVGDLMDAYEESGFLKENREMPLGGTVTIGALADEAAASKDIQALRDKEISITTTIGKVFDLAGEEALKERIETLAGKAGYNAVYEYSRSNILEHWATLIRFVLVFALLSTITLEFIDKDKR